LAVLRSKDVFLPSYWPIASNQVSSSQSKDLSNRQMSIITDQRYSEADLQKQVELVKKHIKL
jgi:hypothetical protein